MIVSRCTPVIRSTDRMEAPLGQRAEDRLLFFDPKPVHAFVEREPPESAWTSQVGFNGWSRWRGPYAWAMGRSRTKHGDAMLTATEASSSSSVGCRGRDSVP
jgi:hypothetical protein